MRLIFFPSPWGSTSLPALRGTTLLLLRRLGFVHAMWILFFDLFRFLAHGSFPFYRISNSSMELDFDKSSIHFQYFSKIFAISTFQPNNVGILLQFFLVFTKSLSVYHFYPFPKNKNNFNYHFYRSSTIFHQESPHFTRMFLFILSFFFQLQIEMKFFYIQLWLFDSPIVHWALNIHKVHTRTSKPTSNSLTECFSHPDSHLHWRFSNHSSSSHNPIFSSYSIASFVFLFNFIHP